MNYKWIIFLLQNVELNNSKNEPDMISFKYLIKWTIETVPTTAFTLHIIFSLSPLTGETTDRFRWLGMLKLELHFSHIQYQFTLIIFTDFYPFVFTGWCLFEMYDIVTCWTVSIAIETESIPTQTWCTMHANRQHVIMAWWNMKRDKKYIYFN